MAGTSPISAVSAAPTAAATRVLAVSDPRSSCPPSTVLSGTYTAQGEQSPADTARVHELLTQLSGSPTGRRLVNATLSAPVNIRIGSRAELSGQDGPAMGRYYRNGRVVLLRRDVADSPSDGVATLAHELQHFADDVQGVGLGSLRSEARAFRTEAQVVRELGLPVRSFADAADGGIDSEEAVMDTLARSAPYGHLPRESGVYVAPPRPVVATPVAARTEGTAFTGSAHPTSGAHPTAFDPGPATPTFTATARAWQRW